MDLQLSIDTTTHYGINNTPKNTGGGGRLVAAHWRGGHLVVVPVLLPAQARPGGWMHVALCACTQPAQTPQEIVYTTLLLFPPDSLAAIYIHTYINCAGAVVRDPLRGGSLHAQLGAAGGQSLWMTPCTYMYVMYICVCPSSDEKEGEQPLRITQCIHICVPFG